MYFILILSIFIYLFDFDWLSRMCDIFLYIYITILVCACVCIFICRFMCICILFLFCLRCQSWDNVFFQFMVRRQSYGRRLCVYVCATVPWTCAVYHKRAMGKIQREYMSLDQNSPVNLVFVVEPYVVQPRDYRRPEYVYLSPTQLSLNRIIQFNPMCFVVKPNRMQFSSTQISSLNRIIQFNPIGCICCIQIVYDWEHSLAQDTMVSVWLIHTDNAVSLH